MGHFGPPILKKIWSPAPRDVDTSKRYVYGKKQGNRNLDQFSRPDISVIMTVSELLFIVCLFTIFDLLSTLCTQHFQNFRNSFEKQKPADQDLRSLSSIQWSHINNEISSWLNWSQKFLYWLEHIKYRVCTYTSMCSYQVDYGTVQPVIGKHQRDSQNMLA